MAENFNMHCSLIAVFEAHENEICGRLLRGVKTLYSKDTVS